MNCAVEKDKELLNVQVPKASTNKEAEEYQPVTPSDLRIDTDFNTKQKEEDKLEEGRRLLWKRHVRLNHLPF